jgi:hypothetical protein
MYTYDYRDRAFFEQAYDLLVRHLNAVNDAGEKKAFVDAYCQREHRATEWRFGGSLGFGGKFWRNAGRFYVSCYPEDATKTRKKNIAKVDAALKTLAETLQPYPDGPGMV